MNDQKIISLQNLDFFVVSSCNFHQWLDSDLIPRLLEIFEKLKFFDHFIKRKKITPTDEFRVLRRVLEPRYWLVKS